MNAEQLKGKWMQFKGELKQQYGKFTDDDLTQIEGNYDKFVGKVQERYGDKKDELMKWAEQWHQQAIRKIAGKLGPINEYDLSTRDNDTFTLQLRRTS